MNRKYQIGTEENRTFLQEARENPDVEIVSELAPLAFDEDGNLF